ncbi:MAG TPA: hypothetical protein VFL12_04690 [Thermoanaerobaculia bacterium]|nr:hypothetical protein [Thermoanaerobaculia bacterium]
MRLRPVERAIRLAAERSGTAAWIVGGAVRDALAGLPVADIDVAVPEGEERLARELSALGLGSAFPLAPASSPAPVWRVAREGSVIDVARFERGASIRQDLSRRDFTVNAMAREVGTERLLDPFRGASDLAAGRIRSISDANLRSDPLRVLRAYRLAATRGWRIVPRTRQSLSRSAPAIADVAAERVHDELARLLAGGWVRAIGWAAADGVLAATLGIPGTRAVGAAVRRHADAPREPRESAAAARLAVLFRAAGIDADTAVEALRRTKFSRAEVREVALRRRFLDLAFSDAAPDRVLFPFRDAIRPLLRLAASAAAGRREAARVRELARAARRVETREAPVGGDDVREWLGIPSGPEVGRRLEAARWAWFTRRWRSRREIRDGLVRSSRIG